MFGWIALEGLGYDARVVCRVDWIALDVLGYDG